MASYDLIVVGEGFTGLACARHAASFGLKTATTEGNLFGGLIINIGELEGHEALEGHEEPTSGVDVASGLMESNAAAGIENLSAQVTALEPSAQGITVVSEGGEHFARAVVIATGARLSKLGVPGEDEFDHRGVSQCADCDGPMFQGEHVVVVGGGDSAFQEATALSQYVDRVTLLLRGERPRARREWVERVQALPNAAIRTGVRVRAIVGTDTVSGVELESAGGAERLACAGVFVFVGLTPSSEIAPPQVERDGTGALRTDAAMQTAVPGLYAAGAVRAGYGGRLVDAVREARTAAESIARSLAA